MSLTDTERARRREVRDSARRDASKAVAAALLEADATQTETAQACHVAPSKAQRWADPSATAVPTLADLLLMPREVQAALLRRIADALGMAVVELPAVQAGPDDLRIAARTSKEASDVVATLLEGLADGHLTAAEGRELAREADELVRVALEAREVGRRAVRERVVPLRRVAEVG